MVYRPQVVRSGLIPAGLVVSCVFLAATLLCHLCVAPLRDLHGLCLAAYVAALLVADATLFVTQAFSKLLPPSACISVGKDISRGHGTVTFLLLKESDLLHIFMVQYPSRLSNLYKGHQSSSYHYQHKDICKYITVTNKHPILYVTDLTQQ